MSTKEWIKNMWGIWYIYTHNEMLFGHKKENPGFATTPGDLAGTILSEMWDRQRQMFLLYNNTVNTALNWSWFKHSFQNSKIMAQVKIKWTHQKFYLAY